MEKHENTMPKTKKPYKMLEKSQKKGVYIFSFTKLLAKVVLTNMK